MEGSPASMSAYAKAQRNMFAARSGPGPADYDVKSSSIPGRSEMMAPFDTTADAHPVSVAEGPGPVYYPFHRDRREYGSPPFLWSYRIPPEKEVCGESSGYWGRIPDPWMKMTDYIKALNTMRPRVPFEKYVSNNIPTVYHPLDVRCFIVGIDGRMYPWTMLRPKSPGPSEYNTYKIYTSQSKMTPKINFSRMAARKDLFPPAIGAGPAAYVIRWERAPKGGTFLGMNSQDPASSSLRMFEAIERHTLREGIPSPASVILPTCFDKYSEQCVSAPFKSKTKLGFTTPAEGPGPAAHFLMEMTENDLEEKLQPGIITTPPVKAAFDTSQRRFANGEEFEEIYRPSPSDYTLKGFTDELQYQLERHPAAIINPKLGFLTSAEARPGKDDGEPINVMSPESCHCLCEPRRKWRNLRPKRGQTYGYNGKPPKYPDSPGPIYDTAPGAAAIKSRKSWLDPRKKIRTGFLNSGCERRTEFIRIDKDVPGPGKYYSKLPTCRRVIRGPPSCPGPRFKEYTSVGPGPTHKLHEMAESSIWRASHLGTFNSYLKHVGVLFPWAGGFHKKNLTQAGDEAWHIKREDDYAQILCPNLQHPQEYPPEEVVELPPLPVGPSVIDNRPKAAKDKKPKPTKKNVKKGNKKNENDPDPVEASDVVVAI